MSNDNKGQAPERLWIVLDEYPANWFRGKPSPHLKSTEYIRFDLAQRPVVGDLISREEAAHVAEDFNDWQHWSSGELDYRGTQRVLAAQIRALPSAPAGAAVTDNEQIVNDLLGRLFTIEGIEGDGLAVFRDDEQLGWRDQSTTRKMLVAALSEVRAAPAGATISEAIEKAKELLASLDDSPAAGDPLNYLRRAALADAITVLESLQPSTAISDPSTQAKAAAEEIFLYYAEIEKLAGFDSRDYWSIDTVSDRIASIIQRHCFPAAPEPAKEQKEKSNG